jgi:hypothetical protein
MGKTGKNGIDEIFANLHQTMAEGENTKGEHSKSKSANTSTSKHTDANARECTEASKQQNLTYKI